MDDAAPSPRLLRSRRPIGAEIVVQHGAFLILAAVPALLSPNLRTFALVGVIAYSVATWGGFALTLLLRGLLDPDRLAAGGRSRRRPAGRHGGRFVLPFAIEDFRMVDYTRESWDERLRTAHWVRPSP